MSPQAAGSGTTPEQALRRIQVFFRERGVLGKTLTLSHRGQKYLAHCDAEAFAVYRLLANSHLPPGKPGWPVCLVTAESVIDETSPPHLEGDEFSTGLALADWLRLIDESLKK
jgi:hypothetical protein